MMGFPRAEGVGWCVPPEVDGLVLCDSAGLLSQPACSAPDVRSGLCWLKESGEDSVGCG